MNQARLSRLKETIIDSGMDGVALMPGPNMVYISGIHSHTSERPILLFVPADDDPAIIIPSLEEMKAEVAGIESERIFAWSDEDGYTSAFQQACAQLEMSDYLLGIEALHMRVLEYELLKRYAPGLTTIHAEPVMTEMRLVKDSQELAAMDRAVAVAEIAMERLLPKLKLGQTEKQIAAMLMQELMEAGGEAMAFSPIVQTGPSSASPHGVPSDRALQAGDLLLFDWGVLVDDYPSDITRTFAAGPIDDELRHVYDVVLQANKAGKAAARPGATCASVDRAARQVIEAAGYGQQFIHRTGHGLGLEVHEPPYIMEGNDEALMPGNVFTVEPGIYLPGRGGVRIEDNLVITADGHRSLTSYPRELIFVAQ